MFAVSPARPFDTKPSLCDFAANALRSVYQSIAGQDWPFIRMACQPITPPIRNTKAASHRREDMETGTARMTAADFVQPPIRGAL